MLMPQNNTYANKIGHVHDFFNFNSKVSDKETSLNQSIKAPHSFTRPEITQITFISGSLTNEIIVNAHINKK